MTAKSELSNNSGP